MLTTSTNVGQACTFPLQVNNARSAIPTSSYTFALSSSQHFFLYTILWGAIDLPLVAQCPVDLVVATEVFIPNGSLTLDLSPSHRHQWALSFQEAKGPSLCSWQRPSPPLPTNPSKCVAHSRRQCWCLRPHMQLCMTVPSSYSFFGVSMLPRLLSSGSQSPPSSTSSLPTLTDYDHAPIAVLPNTCALPEHNGRTYTPSNDEACATERRRRSTHTTSQGATLHPQAFTTSAAPSSPKTSVLDSRWMPALTCPQPVVIKSLSSLDGQSIFKLNVQECWKHLALVSEEPVSSSLN